MLMRTIANSGIAMILSYLFRTGLLFLGWELLVHREPEPRANFRGGCDCGNGDDDDVDACELQGAEFVCVCAARRDAVRARELRTSRLICLGKRYNKQHSTRQEVNLVSRKASAAKGLAARCSRGVLQRLQSQDVDGDGGRDGSYLYFFSLSFASAASESRPLELILRGRRTIVYDCAATPVCALAQHSVSRLLFGYYYYRAPITVLSRGEKSRDSAAAPARRETSG